MKNVRRYDIDWLRVLVFGLLILYHVGMFFNTDNFHIKNNETYSWLGLPMYFLNRWRLPILFVISGMGTFFALSRRNWWKFSGERIIRLFIPLVFGMLIIVPPQVYIERLVNGQIRGGFFDFWPDPALVGVYPEGNMSWHHLWFILYLLIFSLVWLPLFLYIKKHPVNWISIWLKKQLSKPLGVFWFCIPLIIVEFCLSPFFPQTHGLIGDWYVLGKFFFLFGFGFFLMSVKEVFWAALEKYRRLYLSIAIGAFLVLYLSVWIMEDTYFSYALELAIIPINYWGWILVLFAFAAKYLNWSSPLLTYANEAVYSFYILHQTITIIIGYYIMNLDWGFLVKYSILVVGTFGGSWGIYEVFIRRWKLVRPFFGMKLSRE